MRGDLRPRPAASGTASLLGSVLKEKEQCLVLSVCTCHISTEAVYTSKSFPVILAYWHLLESWKAKAGYVQFGEETKQTNDHLLTAILTSPHHQKISQMRSNDQKSKNNIWILQPKLLQITVFENLKKVAFEFFNFGISRQFLSSQSWPVCLTANSKGFQKLAKMDHFWHF